MRQPGVHAGFDHIGAERTAHRIYGIMWGSFHEREVCLHLFRCKGLPGAAVVGHGVRGIGLALQDNFVVFFIVSKCEIHSNHIFWIFGTAEFFLLHRLKDLVRNNGLMGVGVKIPIHEAIIFDLNCAGTDCFLK